MTRRRSLAAAIVSLCAIAAAHVTAQAPQAPANARAAVRTVVESYLHGLQFNNVEDLKKAFWPDAKLYFTKPDGTLGQLTQAEWYAGFEKSAGQEAKVELRIANLEVVNDIASVKITEDYPRSRYTDYLSLIRFGDRWQIVNKIYTAEKK